MLPEKPYTDDELIQDQAKYISKLMKECDELKKQIKLKDSRIKLLKAANEEYARKLKKAVKA